jgi:hypothetical protein
MRFDLQPAHGPYVIVGRPRSGSRVVARLCAANGVFLGADLTGPPMDSWSWYQRFTVPLISSRYFPDFDERACPELLAYCEERIQECWPRYWNGAGQPQAWGWKYCESLFAMPLIKRSFPSARFIHIIRDARDVCLSLGGYFQLTGDHREPPGWDPPVVDGRRPEFKDFCLLVTFGDRIRNEWRGISLEDRGALAANRFLLQAKSWKTCVVRARQHGNCLGNDYFELRYEDLCRDPSWEAARLFRWMGLPVRTGQITGMQDISSSRVNAWRAARLTAAGRRDFDRATELVGDLLPEFGYEQ